MQLQNFIKVYLGLFLLLIGTSAFAQNMKPEETEVWEPVPSIVTPGENNAPPSDAIVLFNGKDLSQWRSAKKETQGQAAPWTLEKGEMVVKPATGDIETVKTFGSIQLHIEWLAPVDKGKESQQYSNSGIFLMGLYELQVLNSYENKTYSNGQAGSLYKQHIPLVNASKKPGTWQEYDVIFTAPVFESNGELKSPARITVLHNGVLIQNNVELKGPTLYIGHPKYEAHPAKLPLKLQDHGNLVRFRNIWVRELN
ncbi:MAG: DUF1080 domain-containing protein [Microscillaceae bacterium]|nr:DUF1080 domain-containing protein [Microscillaceae bacterium]